MLENANAAPLLSTQGLKAGYGDFQALHAVDIRVDAGEIVALIGSNGAGKSTTLRSISGLTPPRTGSIRFEGKDITTMAAQDIVRIGIAQSPEGRQLFVESVDFRLQFARAHALFDQRQQLFLVCLDFGQLAGKTFFGDPGFLLLEQLTAPEASY